MFLERLTNKGLETNKYFVKGGKFNESSESNQMPNCTQYCYLRTFEACEVESKFPVAQSGLGYPKAKDWWVKSPLPHSNKIKAGSIAVFDGNDGHVAFVEEVIDETHALISQSQYDNNKSLRNYRFWEKREVELIVGEATLSGVGKLLGFLETPINDIRVNRNSDREQIEIIESMVNVRFQPEGSLVSDVCYCPKGIYNVLETRLANGYKWFMLEENHWVREGEWLIHHDKQSANYSDLYWAEVDKNKALLKKLEKIKEVIDE